MGLSWCRTKISVDVLQDEAALETIDSADLTKSPSENLRAADAQDYVGTAINVGHRLGFIPYKYDHVTRKTLYDAGLKAKIKFGANVLALLVYEAFIFCKFVITLGDEESQAESTILEGYVCIVCLCLNVVLYIFLATYGTLHHVWNELMAVTSELKLETDQLLASSNEKSKWYQRKLDTINRVITIMGAFAVVMPVMLRALKVLRRPQSFELISSAFENPQSLSFGVKLILALLQLNISGFHLYFMYLSGCIVITYVCSVLPILQNMKLEGLAEQNWKLARIGRTINKVSTRLRVVQACFNDIFKLWPLATEVLCVVSSVMRLFLAVKLGLVNQFIVGLLILGTMLSFFIGFAEIHGKSEEAHKSWASLREPRWFPKYLRSCRSMNVSVGDFFYADKSLVLTIIDIVISNLQSLVLSTGELGHE